MAPAPWSRDWIVEQLPSVLDMAEAAVGLSDMDDVVRLKIVAETALLVRLMLRTEGLSEALRDRARRLGERIVPEARSARVLRIGALRPAAAAEVATAHIGLADAGIPDDGFGRRVVALLADPASWSSERLPWKELEQLWLRGRLGGPGGTAADAALALTSLARGLDVLAADRDELYGFTHAIIYVTDFGERDPRMPRELAEILADADAALVRTIVDQDFDIAAELLLAYPYTRTPWSAEARYASRALRDAVDAVGILPSLGFRTEVHAGLSRAEGDAYAIRESYHTQYVWGFLLLATLLPGVTPPGEIVDDDERRAFTRDSALWMAVRDDDLSAAADALSDRSIPPTSLSRRAERLFVRLATWAGGISAAAAP